MNYGEFKKRDPALANAVAELVGNYSPDYYRGFIRAVNIVQGDRASNIDRSEEYKAYCKFKIGEPGEVQIKDMVVQEPEMPEFYAPQKRKRKYVAEA